MMYVLANMWFTKLIKQFFFWIDKIVYNFISSIYDLLITIARTSVLTQADIVDMADRIYKLLAIFMIFKVTLSLITYVVNPDDFSDKSKGVSKLGTNIIISLAMLILTPYIFNYAYQFQTIILEDNSLATLIFGGEKNEENSFFNTAGDDMAFITMNAFIGPNLSVGELHECSKIIDLKTKKFDKKCKEALSKLTDDEGENFSNQALKNYVAGMENNSLGLLFRQDLVLATTTPEDDDTEQEFIMDYKFVFSTVVGVVIILLLITFCMDVAVRSIKLAFLQLIAPIPIISYVDPKSGKDGLFKKWYEMCFKTFLSLFVRLLALYFAVYIISKVADMKMVDIVNGSYQTGFLLSVFIIIGALMFAKQLPKILEGLGIKLDGDGKFFLNPFKKFEEEAIGGKRITGAAGGAVAGLIGGRANPLTALSGAARGFVGGKGYSGGLAAQADVNRKMSEARIKGAGFWGSRAAALSSRYGLDDADLEGRAIKLRKNKRAIELARRDVDSRVKDLEVQKKAKENAISPKETAISKQKALKDKIDNMEKFSSGLIENGKAGKYSEKYRTLKTTYDNISTKVGQKAVEAVYDDEGKEILKKGEIITQDAVQKAEGAIGKYLNKTGRAAVMDELLSGTSTNNGGQVAAGDLEQFEAKKNSYDVTLKELNTYLEKEYNTSADIQNQISLENGEYSSYKDLHDQAAKIDIKVSSEEDSISEEKAAISRIDRQIKNEQVSATVKISGYSEEISLEEAERIAKEEEEKLKDDQEQRNLNRTAYKDRRFSGNSK